MRKHGIKRCGLRKALSKLEMDFEEVPHRGADDAYNIARILVEDFNLAEASADATKMPQITAAPFNMSQHLSTQGDF